MDVALAEMMVRMFWISVHRRSLPKTLNIAMTAVIESVFSYIILRTSKNQLTQVE